MCVAVRVLLVACSLPAGGGVLVRPPLLAEIAAGALGGIAKTALFYPLDTLTTRAEVQRQALGAEVQFSRPAAPAPWPRPLELYRGLAVAILCSLPYATVFHTANSLSAGWLSWLLPALVPDALAALSAAAASVAATTIGVPLEFLKHRAQVRAPGFETLASSLARARADPRALYTGFQSTLARNVPYNALHFGLYAAVTRMARALLSGAHSPAIAPFCGALAGALVSFLTQPMDVLNTRRQVGSAGLERTGSVWTSLQLIAKREGPSALFRGWRPRCVLYAVSAAFFFSVYSTVLERWPADW
ncbi:mitochondrial carrier domain-containing protein [Pavlovales sp. CCMP2436]|nr:mitochondrial carrier domain-containing protein [Pavlovales sp. CCMP2436]